MASPPSTTAQAPADSVAHDLATELVDVLRGIDLLYEHLQDATLTLEHALNRRDYATMTDAVQRQEAIISQVNQIEEQRRTTVAQLATLHGLENTPVRLPLLIEALRQNESGCALALEEQNGTLLARARHLSQNNQRNTTLLRIALMRSQNLLHSESVRQGTIPGYTAQGTLPVRGPWPSLSVDRHG